MTRLTLTTCAIALATTAHADERALTGPEIYDLLPTIIALGVDENTRQDFSVSGQTGYYADGRPSVGKWWVTATQYCSSWPPGSGQACYDVYLDESATPPRLIWIGASGERIENTIIPKE